MAKFDIWDNTADYYEELNLPGQSKSSWGRDAFPTCGNGHPRPKTRTIDPIPHYKQQMLLCHIK